MTPMIRSVKNDNKHSIVLDRVVQHFMWCGKLPQNVVCMRGT
jgi:hypothetical protein